MKVLYDHQTFSLQEYGGISRIYTELLRPPGQDDVETELALFFSNNSNLKELKDIRALSFLPKSNWSYKPVLLYKLNKLYSLHKLKTTRFDIFHPTYYDPYFLRNLKGRPFVVTFLDMIHEKFSVKYKEFSVDQVINNGKKTLLKEATKIIAISESTKNDIVEIFGVDRDKIDVIYLGSSLKQNKLAQKQKLIDEQYILFIGNRGAYKNFNFFIEAIVPLLNEDRGLKVLCGGGGKFSGEEILLIGKLGLTNKVIHVPIQSDNTLINLYSNAICFVFPSLYEGFGIPLLEAFSCGCPCATSNRNSLLEIGGDAVVYFNPEEHHSILNAVSKLVNNTQLQKEVIEKAYKRNSLFSWDKTRQQTFSLYKTLL